MDPIQGAFRALADPTRRQILMRLAEGEMTIADVSSRFDITRAAVKKHLVVLQQGRLIEVEARGRERINRLNPEGMQAAARWLRYFDRFWDDKLAKLKSAVEKGKIEDD